MTVEELKQELEKYSNDLIVCVTGEGDIVSVDEIDIDREELVLMGEHEV